MSEPKAVADEKGTDEIDEALVWGEIPEDVTLTTIGGEEITVVLRFPAKKELQVIAVIRKEVKKAGTEVEKLVNEDLNTAEMINLALAYIPELSIQVAALLMEREKTWVEKNLSFISIAKVVKPFFMSWLNILDRKTLETFLQFGLS